MRRFQLRCVLEQPLVVAQGAMVRGELRLTAHSRQSYDVHLTLTAPPFQPGMPPQTVRRSCSGHSPSRPTPLSSPHLHAGQCRATFNISGVRISRY